MSKPCVLIEINGMFKCERHDMFHNGPNRAYALGTDSESVAVRLGWDRIKFGEQNNPLPSLMTRARNYIATLAEHVANGSRMVPLEVRKERWEICEPCEHRNREMNACSLCGCGLNEGNVLGDKLSWEVSRCPINKWRRSPASWQPITTRHLLYHIYPVQNGHWQWNVEQLCGRLKAFNGQKIVAIVTDPPSGRLPDPSGPNSPDNGRHIPGCDTAEMVKEEFAKRTGEEITFLEMTNDPSLREVKTFVPMLERVISDDPSHSLLYAQAKGTTRHNGHIARRWTEALYEIMFDYFPLADEQLMTYPVTGCFKKLGHGWSPDQSKSDWHYSGSWFWVRTAELENRNWQKIDQFWSGIEPYPSQQFNAKEAGCMFHTDHVPNMNLYNGRYWRRVVLPAFEQWRIDNARYRTEMWPR